MILLFLSWFSSEYYPEKARPRWHVNYIISTPAVAQAHSPHTVVRAHSDLINPIYNNLCFGIERPSETIAAAAAARWFQLAAYIVRAFVHWKSTHFIHGCSTCYRNSWQRKRRRKISHEKTCSKWTPHSIPNINKTFVYLRFTSQPWPLVCTFTFVGRWVGRIRASLFIRQQKEIANKY